MGLIINQTFARLKIETIPSRMEMHTEHPKLELHQKHAKINIDSELPRVIIDSSESRRSAGIKDNGETIKEAADLGRQQALEYIAKTTSDGRMLTAIENGGNAIAEIAKKVFFRQREFVLDFIPKVRPKIDVEGSITITAEPNGEGVYNGVEGNFIEGRVDIQYTPAVVKIGLMNYASLKFSYQSDKIDTYV